jgi:hypothetical protein
MKNLNKIKATALAVALLAGSQSAHAVTPWQSNDGFASNYGTPDVTIYTSGGAAQDTAFYLAVKNILAEPGTLDTFDDYDATKLLTGSRFTGFYFIGKSTLPATLAGKKIYFEKRSLGAAGYGVVPLQANLTLDHLNIFTSIPADGTSVPANQAAAWVLNTDVTPSDPKRHQAASSNTE